MTSHKSAINTKAKERNHSFGVISVSSDLSVSKGNEGQTCSPDIPDGTPEKAGRK